MAENAAKASNAFASGLFRMLAGKGSSQNIFFSPMSISTALAMTFLGAQGETASQMKQTLHFHLLEESLLHQSFADLSALIYRANAPYTLRAANRLFGHKGLAIVPAFAEGSKKHYGANIETLDFIGDAEGSRQLINSWVEKQTENRIKDLLAAGSIDALTRLVLVNAIYFKGDWVSKFEVSDTSPEKFHISANEDISVPMMHKDGKFNYARDDSVRSSILELPYIKKEVSMFIVLPDQVNGLADVQKKLSQEKIEEWVTEARRMRDSPTVIVSLPKFSLEQNFVLNDVLREMGMVDPFRAGKADFSGMTGDKDLFISQVIHKAFLDVNEEGSEAAAATAVVMAPGCALSMMKPLEFKADHPFLIFIYDNKSQAVLFMGQLCRPKV
ncbi:leukocyte elastase inhibitor-like [Acanthaster planci]|uniref:Leukocyte elastase inhibitor-like n=1 Tax=Acanthaster planci TaxID=133434 RepID=A0A8B7Z1T9_ACAPL|nr:leukocyte elastase inhibitor-like [Acanthaster planci]XP_022098746.1 leukocyte elastase inhibitor-like [Acanthaster planci]